MESQASTTNATLAKIEEVGGKFQQVGEKMGKSKGETGTCRNRYGKWREALH